ncbi:MAG: pantetheine-phosphate adenylyltransferase [Bacteroidia bacterium]|nr:pantetheine-phosphate adenylyltransferase [Bacteroidia bacterium]
MQRIAIFPGSFDPITKGHESVVKRALPLFDKIIIAIGVNAEKKDSFFSLEKRIEWIKQTFKNEPNVEVMEYSGLTVDFCKKMNARFILRGLRTSADFEFERAIAQTNRFLANNIETIFLLTTPEHTPINSTIVREVYKNGGDASLFVPDGIILKQ